VEQLFKALQFHERKGWEAAVRSGTEADERPDVLVLPVCSSPATRPSPVLYPPFARYPSLTRYPPFTRYPPLTRYAPLTRSPPLSSATISLGPATTTQTLRLRVFFLRTLTLATAAPYPLPLRRPPLTLTLATAAPYPLPLRRLPLTPYPTDGRSTCHNRAPCQAPIVADGDTGHGGLTAVMKPTTI
jgi:hypothetical protein